MSFDPYAELGVPKDADESAVRRAYRNRAKKTHPDKRGGDRAKFERASRALAILVDPNARRKFDDTGSAEEAQPDNLQSEAVAVIMQTIIGIIDESARMNQSPTHMKFVDVIALNIRRQIDEGEKSKRVPLRQIDALGRVNKRLRRKGKKTSIINLAIDAQIRALQEHVSQISLKITRHQHALELVMDHEFDVEEVMASESGFAQHMARLTLNVGGQ